MLTREQVRALTGREFDAAVAEHVFGWRWWAWTKFERDRDGPRTERVVRTLRPPNFDPAPWERWAAEDGKVFRPATGEEPVERIQCTGDAFRVDVPPPFHDSAEADYEVLQHVREKWGERVLVFALVLYGMLGKRDASEHGTTGIELLVRYYRPGDYARAALLTLAKE